MMCTHIYLFIPSSLQEFTPEGIQGINAETPTIHPPRKNFIPPHKTTSDI